MELRIKQACHDHGTTIKELAEILGVNPVAFGRTINGNPTIGTLEKIANALGVPVGELLEEPQQAKIICPHCGKPIKVKIG